MIKIDGSHGEGGGQIVRTALAFSTITQIPFEVDKIRIGRSNPGLKPQHMHCIKALEKLCKAKTEGAEIKSSYLKYEPEKIKGQTLEIDIGTAGSITLLLQALLLPCFFADKKVKLKLTGGTNVAWSMPIEYLQEILLPQIRRFCEKIELKLIKRGYYPKGGGKAELTIVPKHKLADFDNFKDFLKHIREAEKGIDLAERHHLLQIKGISHASQNLQARNVSERQANAAEHALRKYTDAITIYKEYADTHSPGTGITLWAIYSKDRDDIDIQNPIRLGGSALGKRSKSAEAVGEEAAKNLIKQINSGAPVDEHLADNMIPWMALFCTSKIKAAELTKHTLTNTYVVEQFLGKLFEINKKENTILSKRG